MKNTERLGLALPEGSDYVNIEVINENFKKLDNHNHDGTYAPATHNHDNTYSKTSHSHTATSVGAVPTTRTVNGKALSSDITLDASSVGAAVTETYTATVTISWTKSGDHYYQDIAVSGILATDAPIVDIMPGPDNAANVQYSEAICKIFRITTSANSIRVWATEAISTAFPVQLKVVR